MSTTPEQEMEGDGGRDRAVKTLEGTDENFEFGAGDGEPMKEL